MRHSSLILIILWLLWGPSSHPFLMKSFDAGKNFYNGPKLRMMPYIYTYNTYNTTHNNTYIDTFAFTLIPQYTITHKLYYINRTLMF